MTLHTVAVGRPPASAPVGPPAPPDRRPSAAPRRRAPGDPTEGPDLDLLRRLAARGNGRAFVAADLGRSSAIFEAIDALETSPIQGTIRTVYRERFAPWVLRRARRWWRSTSLLRWAGSGGSLELPLEEGRRVARDLRRTGSGCWPPCLAVRRWRSWVARGASRRGSSGGRWAWGATPVDGSLGLVVAPRCC